MAQDIIIKTNGDEILSKVIEIDTDKIKYKKFENPDAPLYTISKPEVFMIRYANGTKDVMTKQEVQTVVVETTQYAITGAWINKILSDDIIRIAVDGTNYSITIKGTKAPLSRIKENEYALEGSSIRAYAVNNDSIYLKDIEDPASPKLYLVRTAEPIVIQPTKSTPPTPQKESLVGFSVSSGAGASYAGVGANAALRIGSRSFSIQPNVGLGLFTYSLDGSLPISYGAKLYFESVYIGYKYGHMGSAPVDYYYYTEYEDVDGSVLVGGADLYFGKRKNWLFTAGFGINVSGIDLDVNETSFDLGFGYRL